MNNRSPLPILLGGPSGSGKSSLGQFLQGQRWLHLEADLSGKDGIDVLDLRIPWDSFWLKSDTAQLAQELEARRVRTQCVRTIITVPSLVPTEEQLRKSNGVILVRFLSGPDWACMRSFLEREAKNVTNRSPYEAHWRQHNGRLVAALGTSNFARYKIEAISNDGQFISRETLATRLLDLSKPVEA
jgi:hypothetical protein